jgi:hypothetical protein
MTKGTAYLLVFIILVGVNQLSSSKSIIYANDIKIHNDYRTDIQCYWDDSTFQVNHEDTTHNADFHLDTSMNTLTDSAININRADSLPQNTGKDSLREIRPEDTIQTDTLREGVQEYTTKQILEDTVFLHKIDTLRDTIIVDTCKAREDSLIHFKFLPRSKLDSAIAYWKTYALKDTSSALSDSIKQIIRKYLFYAKADPIDSTLAFVKNFLNTDTTFHFYEDSTRLEINDTLYNYLNYVWETTTKDSIRFTVYNRSNDSLNLRLTKDSNDSLRFLLYDHKEYPAGIWIKSKRKNAIKLSFVEDVQITETTPQKTLVEIIPVQMDNYELQEQDHIDMTFPLWDFDGITKAHFNQGYLANWSRGGENSLSSLWMVRYSADYSMGKNINWDNDLEYKVGLLKSGNKKIRKNQDKLEINSKFGSNAVKNWYYSALLNFKTQFFAGYDYPDTDNPVSGFLAPAHMVLSIGMDYKPGDKLTILLSPVSWKFSMVRDTAKFNQQRFGIPEDTKIRKEQGAYLKSIFSIDFNKKISMENKVNFFINYLERNEAMDIDYEMTLNMEVTELINTTINAHFIYDRDVTKKIQFKENLSIGLSYKF